MKIAKSLSDYDDGRCANNTTMRQGISCDRSNILIRVRGISIYSYSFHPNPSWDPQNPSETAGGGVNSCNQFGYLGPDVEDLYYSEIPLLHIS